MNNFYIMKKILLLAASALCLASCEISYPRRYSYISLEETSDKLVRDYVVAPAQLMKTVFAFEEYMACTEDEMIRNHFLYGRVQLLGDNVYSIDTDGILLVFQTDPSGKSIREDGASFRIKSLSVCMDGINSSFYDFVLSKVPEEEAWTLVWENASSRISCEMSSDSKIMWVVGTSGEERYANNVTISFESFGDMSYNEYYDPHFIPRPGAPLAISGQFDYRVYKDGAERDRCQALYRAGFVTTYTTSRN